MGTVYDFIINKEGDIFGPNLLLNGEAEGIDGDVGTIDPWTTGTSEVECIVGGVDVYGDFVFKLQGIDATPISEVYLTQTINSIPFTAKQMQVFAFFWMATYNEMLTSQAWLEVTVDYVDEVVADIFIMPVNAALTDKYAGTKHDPSLTNVNYFFAKNSFDFREDFVVSNITIRIKNLTTSTLYCDNVAIRLSTNVPVSRSVHDNEVMIDKYGVSPQYTDGDKNLVWNSSFERYTAVDATPTREATYWTGGVSDPNTSNSGSYSLKLASSESTIQTDAAAINPVGYGSTATRVSFKSTGGSIKAEVYDKTNNSYFTLTPQPDSVGVTGGGTTALTFPARTLWKEPRDSFSFTPSEHTAVTEYKLKFTNVDTGDAYIDDVMCTPDLTGKWSTIYKDGPKSVAKISVGMSVGAVGHDDPEPYDLWYDTSASAMKYWNGASWTT